MKTKFSTLVGAFTLGPLLLLNSCAPQSYLQQDAAIGAGLGALAGGIIAKNTGDNSGAVQGALLGGAVGGLAGAAVGNQRDLQQGNGYYLQQQGQAIQQNY